MRVTIAAGGTGGHVFPAVAVAASLAAKGETLHWIGRPNSLEEKEAKDLGAEYTPIPLQGLKRKWTLENARSLLQFARGRGIAKKAMKNFQPEVVFALGSYVSAPVISAALSLRLPVLVHEQNVVPGLVVRRYASKVKALLLTKPLVGKPLKGAKRVVGMPLRPNILVERSESVYRDLGLDPAKKTLFFFGGSQGARIFSELGLQIGAKWKSERPDWQILLQTGVANLDWVVAQSPSSNVVPVGHLREMGKAYAAADVIVSRSGAASCAELEAVGKPVVLVPYPYATADHQRLNAEEYIARSGGRLIPQSDLNLGRLEQALFEICDDPHRPMPESAVYEPVGEIIQALQTVANGGEIDDISREPIG